VSQPYELVSLEHEETALVLMTLRATSRLNNKVRTRCTCSAAGNGPVREVQRTAIPKNVNVRFYEDSFVTYVIGSTMPQGGLGGSGANSA
jgi:hypothetical protein